MARFSIPNAYATVLNQPVDNDIPYLAICHFFWNMIVDKLDDTTQTAIILPSLAKYQTPTRRTAAYSGYVEPLPPQNLPFLHFVARIATLLLPYSASRRFFRESSRPALLELLTSHAWPACQLRPCGRS